MERATKSNIESLDLVSKQIQTEISRMPEDELREVLKDKKLNYRGNIKALREQLLNVRLREYKQSMVQAEEVGEAHVDKVEPSVNNELEKTQEDTESHESVLEVVHSPTIIEAEKDLAQRAEAKRREIEARLSAREDREVADRLEQEIHRLSPEPPKETAYSSGAVLSGGRRIAYRNVDSFPFGKPKKTNEFVNKITEQEKPKPEILRYNTPIVLPERKPLMHVDDLGKSKEQKTAVSEKEEAIIQAIVLAQEIVGADNKAYYNENKDRLTMEALKRIGAPRKPILHEGDAEEVGGIADAEPIDKDLKSPEKALSKKEDYINPENVSSKKVPSQEVRDGNIDGLVEFNLDKLGINKTELVREMPEFFNLSIPQQNYVLDKLRQKTKHDIDEGVQDKLNNVKGIKRIFNGFRAGGVRKELVKQIKEKGFESYKENLKDITTFVETRGLDVEMTEKGMVLKFMSREGENNKHQKMIDEFNRKATVLAEIPYNKTLDDRTPLQILQKKKYEKALKEYEEVRSKLLGYESKNAGEQVNAKALEFSNIDDDIRMNQALTYNPEATSWVGKQIQKYGDKGIVLGAGFAVRGMAKYAAGFGGGLVASGVLGGVMGRLRKGKEFQTIANDKRYADKIEAKKGETGPVKEKRAGVKEFIDSRGYAEKINKLVEQIEKTSNPEKRSALIQSLNNRILVARERDEAGLVRFGKSKDELKNKFAFIDSMKSAQRVILESDPKFLQESEKVAERLNNIFFKDEKKAEERKEEMKKAFWKGVRNSAGLFILGFEANDWAFHDGEATKALIDKMEKYGAEMNKVFADIGENVRENLDAVSDQNIIDAGKKFVGGFQNELNKAQFFGKGSGGGGNDFVRMNPVSERLVPGVNQAVSESTSVRLRPNLESLTSEKGSPVNFPDNMPRPGSLPYDSSEMASIFQTPVAESDFGARGAIGAIKDLQRALINQYGGNMPENLKEFVDANPDRLAIKWNMFRPGDMNESIALPKGTKFLALPDGNISLRFPDGKLLGITNVTEKMQFDYFDSGARTAAPTIPNTPANPDMANQAFVSAPENNLSGVDSPQGMNGAPENLGAGTGAETGGKFDFERVKTGLENLGFRHEAVDGGDIFSAEVPTGEGVGPQTVEGYTDIDGLKVDTKELKGMIDFLYDSKGQIKSIDLPALQVEDVSRFRAHPENFIGGSHDVTEKAMLGKKLMTMNSQVETFLKYRRIMEVQSLHPDSPEYKFLHEESNKLWTAIQKKVDYQFNPEYQGFRPGPIENIAPMVEVPTEQVVPPAEVSPEPVSTEPAPKARTLADAFFPEEREVGPSSEPRVATAEDLEKEKALEEAHRVETENPSAREIIKTTNDVIPSGNEMFSAETISKYGPVERSGNVAFFGKGYVGFYEESGKQSIAEAQATFSAKRNIHLIRGGEPIGNNYMNIEGFGRELVDVIRTRGPEGTYRVLNIYKQVE